MGEIGAMVARLEQEGLDLDRLIDDELEAAGFLALSSRSTASLSNRADAISGNQNELKTLLKSIEEQLQKIQREENLPVSVLDTSSSVGQDDGVKHIIIIDDEEEEPTKTDFSCQTNIEISSPPVAIKTSASENICTKNTKNESPSCLNSPLKTTNTNQDKHALLNTQSKPPKVLKVTVPVAILPKPTPSAIHESISKSLVSEEGIIAYRTLKSPTESGRATVTSMVTLKSSQPTIPPQHLRSAATPSMPSASAKTTVPDTRSSNKHRESLADAPDTTKETKRSQSPPKFEEGTRIIGKRADDLWYPGEIIKVVTDRYSQVKFRVKFDQGNRGLLRSNHIALESSPPVDVLNVGSRVVALRPRETADEAASWREAKEGPYGKLDVLYAGIVAEICCPENSNRFLIFFDDGFAQYLPLFKLHHVYHTGDKVWNEVAEHSQEFIQEYLEEFPNRPMVVLKTNQWVKTEWRGKWLKAKVMQVDCSLVKMLFQVDNRSEWIYRGSTRLEPLYRALIDGKISKSKKMKKQRKVSQSPDEPYVDMSLTSLQFGYSLYSKTDPKGTKQKESEKNRRQQPELEGFIRSSKGQDSSSKDSSGAQNTSSSKQSQITTIPPAPSNTTSTTTLSTTNTHTSRKLGIQKNTTKHTIGTNTSPVPANIMHTRKTTGTVMSTPVTNKMVVPYNIQSQGMKRITSNRTVLPKDNTSWSVPDSTVSLGWSNNHLSNVNPIDDSTASIIQASTMRKRTTAGLANKPNLNHVGPAMVHKGADSTTMMMNAPVNNGAVSVMTPVKNNLKWEAPWKHRIASESNNLKQTLYKPGLTNSKHDAAALIQERLQAEKKLTHTVKPVLEIKPLIPKPAVLGPHKCGKQCGQTRQIDLTEKSKHNVLAIPLMLNWKREITQRHPRSKKEIYYRAPCNKRLRSIAEVGKYLILTNTSNVTIDQFCFDPDISCVDTLIDMKNILLPDISHGAESVSISVVNEHDGSYPPPIDYVSDRILSEGVNVVTDPGFLACCDCTDNCQDKTKCSCAQLTISASAAVDGKEDNTVGYDYRKLMDCVPTGIYECNQNCACSSQCFNRVVQNGIQLRLQVFKTENRGWGLRTLDDIPIGTFICTYSGQVMNEDMANKEGRDFGDEYLAELDHIEVVEKIKEGYESSVTDIEDDSVILRTLDGGSSDCSNNRFMSDSDSSSDSDSVISDTSSLYEPVFGDAVTSKSKSLKKEVKNRRSSLTNDTVIFKEDGETFRVTMADEKYVVASASDTGSIVLRRISQPSEVTRQESNKPSEDNSKDRCADPPPMPCEPTVIDLTSSDEDEAISFPVQTNKPSAEDDGDDDGQNKSKASSLHEDSFNLRLDISNDSNLSGEMNQGDVQENLATVPPKSEADQVLADTKKTNQTDTDDVIIVHSASEEELHHDSCRDNSDVKMDTQSNKGCDVGSNGSSSEKDSVGTSDKDTSIIDNNNHESSSGVELVCEQESTPDEANTPSKDVNNTGNEKCADKIGNLPSDSETQPETNHQVTDNDQQEKTNDENDQIKVGDLGNHGSCNHDDAKDNDMHSEHDGNDGKSNDGGLMEEAKVVNDLNMEVDEEKDDTLNPLADNSDQQQLLPASSTDDSVPPLMSADDLSKLAAQLHQPDEEPPKLTKMACGLRLTDLKDTITKLQSRGVALDGVSPETVQDNKTPSFEDLPLFPESSSCDIDSFSPSPSSTDSDSSVSDSIEKSSDASYDRNIRVRNAPNGRRARRFIVTLQKNGLKRSASPGIPGEGPIKKLTTRSLFGEEHCYVIDAKAYGNCGRYLNHSCSPNLFVQNVFIDTHDLRFPRVAFFAQHNISAGSELTWDYMYEVGSVQDKVLRCYCGSSQCRGRLL